MRYFPLFLLLILLTLGGTTRAERRALVIGNAAYRNLIALEACAVDAVAMVDTFRSLGFSIHGDQPHTDRSADQIDSLLREFAASIGPGDDAFFYFSGHGLETDGKNFLLPVEFNAEYTSQVKRQAVELSDVLERLEGTQASLRVVILDACRDPGELLPGEPVAKSTGFRAKGLGEVLVEAPETLVCYATKHGTISLAPTTPGKNSIYTGILAREMRLPGTLEEVFKRVARQVYEDTRKKQLPFTYGSLLNDHRLVAGLSPAPSPVLAPADRLRAASKDAPFVNSLGLEFIPLPGKPGVLMCRTETRVRDFRAYATATGYRQTGGAWLLQVKEKPDGRVGTAWELDQTGSWENPGFSQSGDDPVVCVSWDEANAFCAWLRGQNAEKGLAYRLPTDAEWSLAVGGTGKYPWGNDLAKVSGNYWDQTIIKTLPGSGWPEIAPGYDDGAARTARVASYRENRFGFFDLGGNVWEWCEDWYRDSLNDPDVTADLQKRGFNDGGGNQYRVLRGGSGSSVRRTISAPRAASASARRVGTATLASGWCWWWRVAARFSYFFLFYRAAGPLPSAERENFFAVETTLIHPNFPVPPRPASPGWKGREPGTAALTNRVLRGGSWNNNTENNLRSSNRNNDNPTNRNDNNGFRLVLEVASGGKASSLWGFGLMPGGDTPYPARAPRSRVNWTPNPPSPPPE